MSTFAIRELVRPFDGRLDRLPVVDNDGLADDTHAERVSRVAGEK